MQTSLKFTWPEYNKVTDAITGEMVNPGDFSLEGWSGRWIRCEK